MNKTLGIDVAGSYTFMPDSPGFGTVSFSGISLTLDNIKLITNVTRNEIIYNFADSTAGAASFGLNTLTLDYDTSTHSASDVLQIILDVPGELEELRNAVESLRMAINSLTRIMGSALPDASGRMRVNAESAVIASGTITSVTSVTNAVPVGNVATFGAVPAQYPANQIQGLYADSLRRNISVT
jgi:hypothetical protein